MIFTTKRSILATTPLPGLVEKSSNVFDKIVNDNTSSVVETTAGKLLITKFQYY